jgi:hypothetical protein
MGLVRGMARTAVVAGTATAVSNRVSRRQARRWGGQEQQQYADPQYAAPPPQYAAPPPPQYAPAPQPQYAPAPAADPGGLSGELERLADLHRQGLLTDDEFNAAKAKLLGI